MAKTLEQLLSLSSIIANETKAGANTALRVGGLFSDIIYYLRDLDYADKDDIPSLSGYATEQWVLGKGYLTEHQDLSAYAKKTDIPTIPTKVSAFENDADYATTSDLDNRIDALVNGAPQAYDTLKEIADVLANNINSIDDILTALGTKVSKDDFNTAIANVNSSISALNTELSGKIDLKLDAVTFNELFEKVQLEDGTWAIKAKLGLFSDGFISAKGSNVGGTTSEGGAVALYQLNDVLADGTGVSGAQHGAVFVYDATIGKWKGVAQSEIVPNLTGYAKESWVLQQGFLTQHQDLSDYAKLTDIPTIPTTDINKGVTAYGWGDHSKVGYLIASSLDGYVNDIATDGNGNAITSVSKNGKKLTFTKGATYLTGITSKLVTDALGFTPFDEDSFTKANIKSTLGISDWALASSKPSYTTKEVAEDTNLYFTNARAVAALKSITDGLSGNISTLQGYFTDGVANSALKLSDNGSYTAWGQTFFTNGKPKSVSGALTDVTDIASSGTITTNKIVIGNGTIEWDEANKGFKVTGLYSTTYLSAKGANTNGGSTPSGGGLITSLYRYADLGKTFSDTNNDTFNAYTINKINSDLGSRISVLEGKATNVSFTQSLTSGTQIGTITIDGASKNIYAPTIPTTDINKGVTAYDWGNHASAGYAMASALGGYLPLSGGTLYNGVDNVPLTIKGTTTDAYVRFALNNDTFLGALGINKTLGLVLWDVATAQNRVIIHSGNYTDYTYSKSTIDTKLGGYLPLSGGTIEIITDEGLSVNRTNGTRALISFKVDGGYKGGLGIDTDGVPLYRTYSGGINTLIHSGNIGSQSVASAKRLVTEAGNSIIHVSGSAFYIGDSIYTEKSTNILGNDVRLRYGASATIGLFLNSSGNVGIGTTSSQYKLDVNGTLNAGVYYASITNSIGKNTSGHFRWGKFDEVGGLKLQFGAESGANLAIINSAWNKALFVVDTEGNVTASGTIHSNIGIFSDGYVSAKGQNTSSDMRLKNVLNEVVLSVKDIANAPSVRFSWKNGGGVDVGSSAQYWQGLLPDAVKDQNSLLEMQYGNIALVSAISIAKNMVTMEEDMGTMKQELDNLKKENKELKNRIVMLERGIA